MKKEMIDRFFKKLDEELERKAEVILIGASAASLMGHIRPSLDIDFEIRVKGKKIPPSLIESKILKVSRSLRIAVNYSDWIGGWSRIHYLDYRKTAAPYKQFGKIEVKIAAPEYWTIGKMARFLELDIQDMIKIIKLKKINPSSLINLWARALMASDLSLELGQFRDHVIYFLKHYSKRIWGKEVNSEKLIRKFQKQIKEKE